MAYMNQDKKAKIAAQLKTFMPQEKITIAA